MDVKSFIKNTAEKEKQNHRIVNIMMVALFSLVIIFTLCFGVNVNIGSAVHDDGKEYYVRQNLFQVVDTVLSSTMEKEDAEYYFYQVSAELKDKYDVEVGFGTEVLPGKGETDQGGVYGNLDKFGDIAKELGDNASKVNFLKFKLAYAIAVGNMGMIEHRQSSGSRTIAISGQLVLAVLPQLALIIISIIFLVLAILSLVNKKENRRVKFSLILLLICCFANIVLFASVSFISMNWAAYMVMVLVFLCTCCYILIRHAMMDKKDFSLSMFIHNGVVFLGGLLAFILFLSPLFKMTTTNGNVFNLGWAYIMDYALGQNANMSAVIAYTLTELLMLLLLMLPAVLLVILMMLSLGRFISADYQHNEKKAFMIICAAVSLIIFLIIMGSSFNGGLNISNQFMSVKMNIGIWITQLLTLAGLIVFEYLYKVKPIKKELLIK